MRLPTVPALLFSALLASGLCLPAHAADPLVLMLLRALRDQALSTAIESSLSRPRVSPAPRAPVAEPRPAAESEQLRVLINESFSHLSVDERAELHASLMRILEDPQNAPHRATIVADFTAQAQQARRAHESLARLSEADVRAILAGAAAEFARLPTEQRQEIVQALQRGVPGMPERLQQRLLAELGGHAAR